MYTTLSIGRRLRRAIGVTTGTALIAGLSVVALAPGAVASDLDLTAEGSEVSQESTPQGEPTTEAPVTTPEAAEVVESEQARPEQPDEDAAPAQEAPAAEPDEAEAGEDAEPAESEGVPTASSARVAVDEDEDDLQAQAGNPGQTCPTGTVAVARYTYGTRTFAADFGADVVTLPRTANERRGDFTVVDAGTEITYVVVSSNNDSKVVAHSGPSGTYTNADLVDSAVDAQARVSGLEFCAPVEEEPAAFCPGIDDSTDYRTLFDYEYYAADGSSLGSTSNWTRQLSVEWLNRPVPAPIDRMMVRAVVTLKDGVDITTGECSYDFSLASYEAQGTTFVTSGQQVFVDHATGTITADNTSITLQVDPARCYGQSDLYKTSEVYNGAKTPRGPDYSPITFDGNMIANWMGGLGCETEPGDSEAFATFASSCQDDVVTVTATLDNSLSTEETTFAVVTESSNTGTADSAEDVVVAAGETDSMTFTVQLDETLTVDVRVDDEVIATQTFVGEECSVTEPQPPVVAAYASCENEQLSIDLVLDNPGAEPVTFDLVVDGESSAVQVEGGTTESRVFDLVLGDVLDLQVLVGDEVLLDEVYDANDCLEGVIVEPAAILVSDCLDDELVAALALATVDDGVTFEVVIDGESELVEVAADGVEVIEFALQQDETVTVEVLVDGEVLLPEQELDGVECADPTDTGSTPPPATGTPTDPGSAAPGAGGPTTPGTQPRVLARTGAETWTVALVAALLLAAGGTLVALGGTAPRGRRQA